MFGTLPFFYHTTENTFAVLFPQKLLLLRDDTARRFCPERFKWESAWRTMGKNSGGKASGQPLLSLFFSLSLWMWRLGERTAPSEQFFSLALARNPPPCVAHVLALSFSPPAARLPPVAVTSFYWVRHLPIVSLPVLQDIVLAFYFSAAPPWALHTGVLRKKPSAKG